jgi:SAM-dependent methyltransferase
VRFAHLAWPLHGFETVAALEKGVCTRYPIRFLRYWFPRLLLERLHARTGRPLSILEVGIGDGKMLGFVAGSGAPGERIELPPWIERWDGLDVKVRPATLERFPYPAYIEADIERPLDLGERRYDAIVLLHVLEHLFEPEAALERVAQALRPRGLVIGGSPTMPDAAARLHEPWLRRKHRAVLGDVKAHRHLSVITPGRIRRFARHSGCAVELLAGTFFLRWSGLFVENSRAWAKANLLWGAAFPSLGGEVYFSLRVP